MDEQRNDFASIIENIDPYSMIRDVIYNLWVILIGALAVALIVNMSVRSNYQRTYSTSATFVVSAKTSSNYAYSNLSAATTMATSVSNMLNSNMLQKMVCRDLGMPTFNATAKASVVSDTNLMTLRVTSDTPENAYRIIRSIMNNTSNLTQYVTGDLVLEVLQEPSVPTGADGSFTGLRQSMRAFVLAAIALTALFMLLSYRKDTIKSEKDLSTKLDASSLGMVYYENKYVSLQDFLKRKEKSVLVTEVTTSFGMVERYKKIAANITAQARKRDARVLLVTSVWEHEGKSTVSANIALTLAQQNYKVLLIDGDMRRPTLNKLFLDKKEKLSGSLGALLAGEVELKDALRRDEKRNIYMLLNEHSYQNSTDIVSSTVMKELLEASKETFDYIVIDSPPMSLMADAEVLANLADISLLVVNYDMVLAKDLNDAIDSLRDCRAEFTGCILNKVHVLPGGGSTTGGYGGYGGYGRYGRYGRYGHYGTYGKYGHYGNDNQNT